jgi:HEAT repeat protein
MADISSIASEKDPEKIISMLDQLAHNGKLSDLQVILTFIKNSNEEVKIAATKAAGTIIKENLITKYSQLEKEVRNKLALLLESLDPSIIDEISKDLYSDSYERKLNAIQILGLLKKNPRIKDILITLVKERDVKVRATAVNLLGKVIGPNDSSLILALLNDPDKRVRANTVEALESVGNTHLIPILLRFKNDSNNRIRGNILKALYNLGFTEIENDLLEMLGTSNDLMKASALWVVSQIKLPSKRIENAAARLLLSENEMISNNARNALTVLSTPRSLGFIKYLDLHVTTVSAT